MVLKPFCLIYCKQGIDFGHFGHQWGMVFASFLDWVSFFEEVTFSSLSIRPSVKALHKLLFRVTVLAA